jgi:trans-aconitate 2-methyltransferase
MPWDPDVYEIFKQERSAPVNDLIALVNKKPGLHVIDLGCGTGELTKKLADSLQNAEVTGIDSSAEMLTASKNFTSEHLRFKQRSIEEQLALPEKWDLVFSNAAIQWVDDHEKLLPGIISIIQPGGQLLIQLPSQHHNALNIIISNLADEKPFSDALRYWKRDSPVLSTDRYAQLLFEQAGKDIIVFEKVYPLVLKDFNALYDWVAGTTIRPYLEKMEETYREAFITAFKKRAHHQFKTSPLFYPFKRIIMAATF